MNMTCRRLGALIKKEWLQMLRSPGTWLVGLFVPVILVTLFGFGLSLDLNEIPTALVMGEHTPLTQTLSRRFVASPSFRVVQTPSRERAEALMRAHKVSLIIEIPKGFTRDALHAKAQLGVTIHGVDANAAAATRAYVLGVLARTGEQLSQQNGGAALGPGLSINVRTRFNAAHESSWYLVPGLCVVMMTMVGTFLTSTPVAREYERGTIMSLRVSAARPVEIVLAKFVTYYALGAPGFLLCLIATQLIFHVPLRGSAALLVAVAGVYLAWALSFGLWLSALVKKPFLANQYAIIGSFLPALILSGFLFDLRSIPAPLAAVGYTLPPYYAIDAFKLLFLSGGPIERVCLDIAVLVLWTVGLLTVTVWLLRKTPR